jgi:hypothetical protein
MEVQTLVVDLKRALFRAPEEGLEVGRNSGQADERRNVRRQVVRYVRLEFCIPDNILGIGQELATQCHILNLLDDEDQCARIHQHK